MLNTKEKNVNLPFLIKNIVIGVIFLIYLIFLIFGEKIFAGNLKIYKSLLFTENKEDIYLWVRALSFTILLYCLSYYLRIILKSISKKVPKGKALLNLLCSFIKYITFFGILFAILSSFGVNTVTLLAGAGIIGLIIGLGVQPLIEDIIAGLFIIFEGIFDVGDIVVIDNFRGAVKEVGVRTTQIVDVGGNVKVVNNSDIRNLVNMTSQLSVAVCNVDIQYEESIERVEKIIDENIQDIKKQIPAIIEGPFYLGVAQLGSSGVTLRFSAKCNENDKFQVERNINRSIKLLFDKNNINIPYNQVVVHQAIDEQKSNFESSSAEIIIDETNIKENYLDETNMEEINNDEIN